MKCCWHRCIKRAASSNLDRHLIQSFALGEVVLEQSHEIGRQFADGVLQGKYPYVLTTHIDKGYVHNHIIFYAVDMVKPGQSKGKSYAEWDAQRKGYWQPAKVERRKCSYRWIFDCG